MLSARKIFVLQLRSWAFIKGRELKIPTDCPDCRHSERMKLIWDARLEEVYCAGCNLEIHAFKSQKEPRDLICESCFQDSVQ